MSASQTTQHWSRVSRARHVMARAREERPPSVRRPPSVVAFLLEQERVALLLQRGKEVGYCEHNFQRRGSRASQTGAESGQQWPPNHRATDLAGLPSALRAPDYSGGWHVLPPNLVLIVLSGTGAVHATRNGIAQIQFGRADTVCACKAFPDRRKLWRPIYGCGTGRVALARRIRRRCGAS